VTYGNEKIVCNRWCTTSEFIEILKNIDLAGEKDGKKLVKRLIIDKFSKSSIVERPWLRSNREGIGFQIKEIDEKILWDFFLLDKVYDVYGEDNQGRNHFLNYLLVVGQMVEMETDQIRSNIILIDPKNAVDYNLIERIALKRKEDPEAVKKKIIIIQPKDLNDLGNSILPVLKFVITEFKVKIIFVNAYSDLVYDLYPLNDHDKDKQRYEHADSIIQKLNEIATTKNVCVIIFNSTGAINIKDSKLSNFKIHFKRLTVKSFFYRRIQILAEPNSKRRLLLTEKASNEVIGLVETEDGYDFSFITKSTSLNDEQIDALFKKGD